VMLNDGHGVRCGKRCQLSADTEHVHQNAIFGILVFRVFGVDLEVAELGELARGRALMLDAPIAAGSWWVRSHVCRLFVAREYPKSRKVLERGCDGGADLGDAAGSGSGSI
jgi:hypothetical protein